MLRQLQELLWNVAVSRIGPECTRTVFGKGTLVNIECNRLILSNLISSLLIAGSLFVKFPQIVKIMKDKSTQGISTLALILETASLYLTVSLCIRQNGSFIRYGELAFLLFQNVDIMVLVLAMRKPVGYLFLYVFVQVFLQADLFRENFISNDLMVRLQVAAVPLMIGSKIVQLYNVLQYKDACQLSLLTAGLQTVGSFGRLRNAFISKETRKDIEALFGVFLSSILNGLIFLYLLHYSSKSTKLEESVDRVVEIKNKHEKQN